MARMLTMALLGAALVAAPAQAKKPEHAGKPDHAGKPEHSSKHSESRDGTEEPGAKSRGSKGKGHAKRCARTHRVGYVASGDLEAVTLTPNADGTSDGEVTFAVKRTNRHARDGETSRTFAFDDARVRLAIPDRDGNGTVDQADARPGDRVKVIGKVVRKRKHCPAPANAGEVTVRKVVISDPSGEGEQEESQRS